MVARAERAATRHRERGTAASGRTPDRTGLLMAAPPRRQDFRYLGRLATRWGDVDRMGHINNAKYLTYDEQSRIDYFEQRLNAAGLSMGPHFILARISVDFIEQLHHPADIDYGIRITRMGRSSVSIEGALFVGDHCHARTESVIVWFDYEAQKATPVPEVVRNEIRSFETVKPAE